MLIDENKIEQMIQKEIQAQVEKKLKTFGREAIENVYSKSVMNAVSQYMKNKESELEQEIRTSIQYDADTWKADIVANITYDLSNLIGNALRDNNY